MKKILVVEDEVTFRQILEEKFTEAGFKVLVATTGNEGLTYALTDHPDIIVLDLFMPGMDGMKFLEELRKDIWGKKVPVIVVTNFAHTEIAKDVDKWGVYEYIVKSKTKLEDVVRKVTEIIGLPDKDEAASD